MTAHRDKRANPVGHDPGKEERRQQAEVRQANRNERTPEQQIELIKQRPGKSRKEYARINRGIAK